MNRIAAVSALSCIGALWLLPACGVLSIAMIGGSASAVPTAGGLALIEPQGAWVATLVVSLSLVLVLATSAPMRPRTDPRA